MATLTRSTSRSTPAYKEYVNFLEGYKNGKKDEPENSDSGVSVKSFSLSSSSSNNSSSSINSDVTDFAKKSCVSYNTYLEHSRSKKFNPVKPNLDEKTTKKSEIFIEIQPAAKTVSEVSKIFENKQDRKSPPRSGKINSKISIFERQISAENKPKIAEKPNLGNRTPPPKTEGEIAVGPVKKIENTLPPPPPPMITTTEAFPTPKIEVVCTLKTAGDPTPKPEGPAITIEVVSTHKPVGVPALNPEEVATPKPEGGPAPPTIPPPPPPPMMNVSPPKRAASVQEMPPPPPPMMMSVPPPKRAAPVEEMPPPPPPPMMNTTSPKMQATLIKGPQVRSAVSNPNGVLPTTIDRNDPMVRKLVYGTLRGLYGAYHDKANDIMATLPRDRVKKSHGVQGIIDQIASNGDLEKLNGRVNPKIDQE